MFKIKNVHSQPVMTHTLGETKTGKIRNKLTVLNFDGMLWKEKKNILEKELVNAFTAIPDGVSFIKRKTQKTKINPDGLRIFVHCKWIKRNRFYDYKGKFKLGTLIKSINKQIEGKTKKTILV
jgi:hypothetical protein